MRTTLTLDEDVAARLRSEVKRSGKPFKKVVNETLREGFLTRQSVRQKANALPPFKVKSRPLGLRPGLSYDCIGKLLEELDAPERR